jgi:hypothetical protein
LKDCEIEAFQRKTHIIREGIEIPLVELIPELLFKDKPSLLTESSNAIKESEAGNGSFGMIYKG